MVDRVNMDYCCILRFPARVLCLAGAGFSSSVHSWLSTIHYPLSTRFRLLSIAYCLLVLSGCSGDMPKLGTVHGKVTLDGKPLADAGVVFTPIDGGRQSMAVTGTNGKYALTYLRDIRGAKIGQHSVRISVADDESGKTEYIPIQYNEQTILRENVQAGANQINFTLTSR